MKSGRTWGETAKQIQIIAIACLSFVVVATANAAGSTTLSNFMTTKARSEKEFNENQTIEASIIKDVALMLIYAKTHSASAKMEMTVDQHSYTNWDFKLHLNGTNIPITLANDLPVWEPMRYEPLLTKLANALAISNEPPQGLTLRPILSDLENPTTETMGRISMGLSEKLKNNMFSAPLHEQAALLLAAFGLRERLEPLDDVRWTLCRLTAHLAFAHWSSGRQYGLEGAYALSTAYALMNLETNAIEMLVQLEKDPQSNRAWNRALRTRVTWDYRPLRAVPPESLSRLEWAERIYAVSRTWGSEIAAKELEKYLRIVKKPDAMDSDLFFCIFQGWPPGNIGLGRALYLGTGFNLAMRDLGSAWYHSQGSVLKLSDATELALRLNVEPGPLVHPEGQVDVLDWGAWAMRNQRRLAVIYLRSYEFIRDSWGLTKTDVAAGQKAMDKVLEKLWLVTCLRAQAQPESLREAFDTFATHRNLVPIQDARSIVMAWYKTLPVSASPDAEMQRRLVAGLWINCPFPNGTYVSLEGMLPFFQGGLNTRQMVERMPYQIWVIRRYLAEFHPNLAECERILQPLADYNSSAASTLVDLLPANQIQSKESLLLKLAAEKPDFYHNLASLFQTADPAKASEYFDAARTNHANPVLVANTSEPFILYHLSKGEKQKAERIAIEAEEVGSALGFRSMMKYCAKTHEIDRGLKAALECEQRYEYKGEVLLFIEMVKKEQPGSHELDKLYDQKLRVLFPAGIQPCQETASAAPPQAGALILQDGRRLRYTDVVVSADGKRVDNVEQLRYLRMAYTLRTGDAYNVPLKVFRGHRYLDINESTAYVSARDYTGPDQNGGSKALTVMAPNLSKETPGVEGMDNNSEFSKLRLTGISGLPPHRLAMVNGKTMAEGESAPIHIGAHTLTVRCLAITQRSASVSVDGIQGTKELYLAN